jgi:hypothetical protein
MGREAERILERGIAGLRPPRGAKQRGWHALQERVARPAARPRWVLPVAAALALAAALLLVWSLAGSRAVVAETSVPEQAIDRAATSDAPRDVEPRAATSVALSEETPASPSPTPPPAPVERPRPDPMRATLEVDPLADAAAIVFAGQAALARGEADVALAHARAHARRFPAGALAQEAGALEIAALCKLGQRDRAATAAAALHRRFPASAVAATLDESPCAP